MSALPDLHAYQRNFANYLRRPDRSPPDALAGQRTGLYAELLRNNIEGLLSRSFPVLQACLGSERWRALVGEFFAEHHSRTPYFPRLPAEFVDYLGKGRTPRDDDPGFLAELAHYEWQEIALAIAEEPSPRPSGEGGQPSAHLAPHAWPFSYRWPVHRIGPDHQPATPPAAPSHLLLYRDADDQVRFIELSPPTALLLERIADAPGTPLQQVVSALANDLDSDPDGLMQAAVSTLDAFTARGIVQWQGHETATNPA